MREPWGGASRVWRQSLRDEGVRYELSLKIVRKNWKNTCKDLEVGNEPAVLKDKK